MSITISDRTTNVIGALGNRADLSSLAATWLSQSYSELGMSYNFDELKDSVQPTLTIGTGTYNYPAMSTALGSSHDGYATRAVESLTVIDPDTGARFPLRYKDVKYIDKYATSTNGPPNIYADRGKQIHLRPLPDKAYYLLWRVWVEPLIAGTVSATILLLPADWYEILDLGAIMRGHIYLTERDKADEIFRTLYGAYDPNTKRMMPGLIAQRLTTKMSGSVQQDYGMRPNVRSYTSR